MASVLLRRLVGPAAVIDKSVQAAADPDIGYTRDALDSREIGAPPTLDDARDFLALLLDAPAHAGAAIGLGDGLRFDSAAWPAPASPPPASWSP
jgi:hypothetical protein